MRCEINENDDDNIMRKIYGTTSSSLLTILHAGHTVSYVKRVFLINISPSSINE